MNTEFKIFRNCFDTEFMGKTIYYYNFVDSTNNVAKDFAKNNVNEGTIIISETQNKGRGRNNHSWISPKGGLWMSIILKPHISLDKIHYLTLISGISISKTINENFNLKSWIKWPNDIYINDKKISGILTESHIKSHVVDYLILGIGINLNNSKFELSPDLQKKSSSIKDELGYEVNIKDFLNKFLMELEFYYNMLSNNKLNKILNDWRKLTNTLGKIVEIKQGNTIFIGEAYDIDENGSLIIKEKNGQFRNIIAGDCSIKKIK